MKLQARTRLLAADYDKKLYETLFKKLVPNSGKAKTVEGEMLLAISRLIYRKHNDGDYFFESYGAEVCGSFATYLFDITRKLELHDMRKLLVSADGARGNRYDKLLTQFLNLLLEYIVSKDGKYTPNTVSSQEFESDYENEDAYDDELNEDGEYDDDYGDVEEGDEDEDY